MDTIAIPFATSVIALFIFTDLKDSQYVQEWAWGTHAANPKQ